MRVQKGGRGDLIGKDCTATYIVACLEAILGAVDKLDQHLVPAIALWP